MKQEIYGWISPKEKIIECGMYGHERVIQNNEEALAIPEFKEAVDDCNEAQESCQALADSGEHPEWHTYEMTVDGYDWRTLALKGGFIRYASSQGELFFEATPEIIKEKFNFLMSFAEEKELKPVFEPTKF